MVIMMEEKNGIFLGGSDVLVYLVGPVHKRYSTTFVWGHPFSTFVFYDRFFNLPSPSSPSPCMHIYSFRVTPFYVRDFINLILSSPILTLLVCQSFLILFYLINSKIDVFVSNTHHFLASHSVNSSLPQKALPLMMTSNCQVILPSMVADEA